MTRNANDARLLTPGPLTTSQETKEVMLHDWGSRDSDFIEINRRIRMQLLKIASAEASHVCVPLQGSGTFVVEAALGTLIPRDGKALILVNGAYGKRIAKILDYLNREYLVHETAEDTTPVLSRLDSTLAGDSKISHVVVVHCETTSGILNPIGEIADIVARHARSLLIDAMSNKLIDERKIKLIIAGEFYENEKYYRQKIHDLNLSKSIIIFDHYINNDEVSTYFCASDIIVQPYLSATQSGISMIALHFNRPVLATNVGGLSDYIKNNQNGYLIEPSSKKIVDSLLDFFDNKKSKVYEANIKLIKKQYSWSNLVNSFESIFK